MNTTIDRDKIVTDIASVLEVDRSEMSDDLNLLDAGMDSVRLMSLVEGWRAGGVERADFVALASNPVLGAWVRVLTS
jgi:aryl carrier-like protein